MPCRSQYFVSRNVPQGVDRCKRAAGTVRGYELIALLSFADNLSVYLVVYVNFVHEVLADVVQQLMQIRVVVVDVAGIWRMVAIFLQYGKGDTAVDAQRVYRHEALVARFLLDYREMTIAEVLRTDAHQVGVSLPEVAAKHEHVAHSFQCLYLVFPHLYDFLRAETVCRLLTNLEMIDVRDFIRRERNLAGDIVRDVHLAVTRIQLHAILG